MGRHPRTRRPTRNPTGRPSRNPTARPRAPRNPADPEADNRARGGPRAGRHRRARDRPRARDPGVRRQAVPDPLRVDGADARRRPAGARQSRLHPARRRSAARRRRRLPSARRGGQQAQVRGAERRRASRAREPTPEEADENFIKRVVAGPAATRSRSRTESRSSTASRSRAIGKSAHVSGVGGCDFPKQITIPPDHYFMMGDNRGASDDSRYWGPSPETGSSARPSSPTGPRTGSASSKRGPPRRRSRPPNAAGAGRRSCSSSTASSAAASSPGPTRPAAARSPGRWSPPACCSTTSG